MSDVQTVRPTRAGDLLVGDVLIEGSARPSVTAILHEVGMTRVWLSGGTTFLIGTDTVVPVVFQPPKS